MSPKQDDKAEREAYIRGAKDAAAENESLRAENERLTELNWHGAAVIEELKAISEHKSARIAELAAALRPFAQQHFHDSYPDEQKISGFTLRVSDFRRAAAALKGESG